MLADNSKIIKRLASVWAVSLTSGFLISCGSSSPGKRLEVTALRYDTSNLTSCDGDVKNVSASGLENLQVQVEFQNADGNRVRTGHAEVLPSSISAGGAARFSVPYQKGSNDPPVLRCRVLEFQSGSVRVSHEDENGLGKTQ